jgi:hypothetical protein
MRPLHVWADKRDEPDWDRYIAELVEMAMERVEEDDDQA